MVEHTCRQKVNDILKRVSCNNIPSYVFLKLYPRIIIIERIPSLFVRNLCISSKLHPIHVINMDICVS